MFGWLQSAQDGDLANAAGVVVVVVGVVAVGLGAAAFAAHTAACADPRRPCCPCRHLPMTTPAPPGAVRADEGHALFDAELLVAAAPHNADAGAGRSAAGVEHFDTLIFPAHFASCGLHDDRSR
jgi:hypothetical protein